MIKESIEKLFRFLSLELPHQLTEDKINEEVQNLISKNYFFGNDLDSLLEKYDKRTQKKIQDQILKIKTEFVLQMVKNTSSIEKNLSKTHLPLELFTKFGPMIEVITSSGLIQKITDSHRTYITGNDITGEGLLNCIREIANSKELESALLKIDVKQLTTTFNITDLIDISQKFLPHNIKNE